ncbi:hypothetical protein [Verrucosispora sp. WMMC514]|uniref:hypothetical protein n=1 Tax=Verrucosispora sp. WMMC514 TaxID=3015156 RepID=UPI00248CD3ED|nr:hypothetical protein [Verrucosispora sp. WMMC514]WBB94172.1 hypothetical protein O7597_15085 [Verrucosispora sp. WMMC514]
MFGLDLLRLIDARIEAARQRQTAVGTVHSRQSTSRASVVMDGSSLEVPVKVLTHVVPQPGSRVTLTRYGSEWVVDGMFGGAGDLVAVWQASTSSSAVFSETAVLAISGFTFEAQAVYRLTLGGQVQATASGGYSLWRVRDRSTGPFPNDWGQLGHVSHPIADIPFALHGVHYLANPATAPLENRTIAVTAQANSGTLVHFASATKRRFLEIERCPGSPASYPHATTVT